MPRLRVPEDGIVCGDITLRVPRATDADPLFRVLSTERDISYWTRIPWPYARHHARDHVTRAPALFGAGTDAPFVIADTKTDQVLGSVGLHKIGARVQPGSALFPNEVGYWLAPEARGRGVCTRAVRALAEWAFGSVGLDTLWLSVVVGNDASRRVAERSGFVHVRNIAEHECSDDTRALLVFARHRS